MFPEILLKAKFKCSKSKEQWLLYVDVEGTQAATRFLKRQVEKKHVGRCGEYKQ